MSCSAPPSERVRLADELATLGTATLAASHAAAHALPTRIHRFAGLRCAGPARTARMLDGDNLALHQAIAAAEPGDVVLGAVDGSSPRGYFGEIMARACRVKRVVGVVLDATIRDVDELTSLALPVFATGIALADTGKRADPHHGAGFDVVLDDIVVREGDWIVADGSGVVHLRRSILRAVLDAARRRRLREDAMLHAVERGASTLDFLQEGDS